MDRPVAPGRMTHNYTKQAEFLPWLISHCHRQDSRNSTCLCRFRTSYFCCWLLTSPSCGGDLKDGAVGWKERTQGRSADRLCQKIFQTRVRGVSEQRKASGRAWGPNGIQICVCDITTQTRCFAVLKRVRNAQTRNSWMGSVDWTNATCRRHARRLYFGCCPRRNHVIQMRIGAPWLLTSSVCLLWVVLQGGQSDFCASIIAPSQYNRWQRRCQTRNYYVVFR